MTTRDLFYYAIGVFTLMMVGVLLTAREFKQMKEDSSNDSGKDSRR